MSETLIPLPLVEPAPAGSCPKQGPVDGPAPRRKPHREEIPAGACLCDYCTAKCCKYFALPMDKPENWKEYDQVRWFLLHDRAAVFVEDDVWYILVHTTCRHLQADNRCGTYETRPQICRDYTTKNCEYEDDWVYDQYWELPEQVEEYAEAVLGPRKGKTFRTPRKRT